MENFKVLGAHNLPTIDFDADIGAFTIKGRLLSISDEEYITFHALLDWVTEYALKPAKSTNFDINLEFCSSGGIKFIFQILKILESLNASGHHVYVVWHYEMDDDDNGDKGYQFQRLLKLPINVVANND